MANMSSSSASGAALFPVSKEAADKVNCLLDLLEGFGKGSGVQSVVRLAPGLGW